MVYSSCTTNVAPLHWTISIVIDINIVREYINKSIFFKEIDNDSYIKLLEFILNSLNYYTFILNSRTLLLEIYNSRIHSTDEHNLIPFRNTCKDLYTLRGALLDYIKLIIPNNFSPMRLSFILHKDYLLDNRFVLIYVTQVNNKKTIYHHLNTTHTHAIP